MDISRVVSFPNSSALGSFASDLDSRAVLAHVFQRRARAGIDFISGSKERERERDGEGERERRHLAWPQRDLHSPFDLVDKARAPHVTCAEYRALLIRKSGRLERARRVSRRKEAPNLGTVQLRASKIEGKGYRVRSCQTASS